jgi:ketosteroid isomerase-like protein
VRRLSVAVLLLLAALPAPGQQATPIAAPLPSVALPPELDRVLRDYERAWRAKDAAGLADLFAEDGFVLSNGSPPVRGRAAIREKYTGAGGALLLRAFACAVDGKVGYIVGGFGHAAGEPDSGKFVLTLRNEKGRWMITADMDNGNVRRMMAPTPIAMPAPVTPPGSAD